MEVIMKRMNVVAVGLSLALSLTALPALASGDAAKGEDIFQKKCQSCHTAEEGAGAKVGPNLHGIFGNKSGTGADYKYSKAMIEADLVWDEDTLDKYLEKPRSFVKGTKMSFVGLKKESEREDVISYLKTLE